MGKAYVRPEPTGVSVLAELRDFLRCKAQGCDSIASEGARQANRKSFELDGISPSPPSAGVKEVELQPQTGSCEQPIRKHWPCPISPSTDYTAES